MGKRVPVGRGFPSAEEVRGNPLVKVATKKGGNVVTILSLDLSTSCVGWALGVDRELARYGKFVFKSDSSIIGEKLNAFAAYLTVLIDVYEPDRILVEKPLLRKGNTTARHYELLGVVRAVAYNRRQMEILDSWLIAATTVKNLLRVKAASARDPKKRHSQNKMIMVNRVNELTGLSLRFDANSKLNTDDDTADAIALLFAYFRKGQTE